MIPDSFLYLSINPSKRLKLSVLFPSTVYRMLGRLKLDTNIAGSLSSSFFDDVFLRKLVGCGGERYHRNIREGFF